MRGLEFVTRKITDGLVRVKLGMLETLELGNLDAQRDWGFARDFVEGMHLMLQADQPATYVLATNRTVSVRDFVNLAAKFVGFDLVWEGTGVEEKGIDLASGKQIVVVSPKFYRPCEVDMLIGDASKALSHLGWKPTTSLETLCNMMVQSDMARISEMVG